MATKLSPSRFPVVNSSPYPAFPIPDVTPYLSWWTRSKDLRAWYSDGDPVGIWPDAALPYDRWLDSQNTHGTLPSGVKLVDPWINGLPGVTMNGQYPESGGYQFMQPYGNYPISGSHNYSGPGPGSTTDSHTDFNWNNITMRDDLGAVGFKTYPDDYGQDDVPESVSENEQILSGPSGFQAFIVIQTNYMQSFPGGDFNNGLCFGDGGTSTWGITIVPDPDSRPDPEPGGPSPYTGDLCVIVWASINAVLGGSSVGHKFAPLKFGVPYIIEARMLDDVVTVRVNGKLGSRVLSGPSTNYNNFFSDEGVRYADGVSAAVTWDPDQFGNSSQLEIGDWGGNGINQTWGEMIAFTGGLKDGPASRVRCYLSCEWQIPLAEGICQCAQVPWVGVHA
jgi:hypothetical protein